MNIDKIDALIKNNEFELFKQEFTSSPINSHHKNLILEKCLKAGHFEFIEYMFPRANSNGKSLIPFFLECLKSPINKDNLIFFKPIEDVDLLPQVQRSTIEHLIKNQTSETYGWFLEKFPITSFRNFSAISYHSFKYDKPEYIKPFEGFQFNYKACYNLCLCAFEYEQPKIINDFLLSQINHNPNIIIELKEHQKELFSNYLREKQYLANAAAIYAARIASNPVVVKKRKKKPVTSVIASVAPSVPVVAPKKIAKEETVNEFITEKLAQTFSKYLEDKFPEKNEPKATKRKI